MPFPLMTGDLVLAKLDKCTGSQIESLSRPRIWDERVEESGQQPNGDLIPDPRSRREKGGLEHEGGRRAQGGQTDIPLDGGCLEHEGCSAPKVDERTSSQKERCPDRISSQEGGSGAREGPFGTSGWKEADLQPNGVLNGVLSPDPQARRERGDWNMREPIRDEARRKRLSSGQMRTCR